MKLDDFLKCKKVRCIKNDEYDDLTIGKTYRVVGVDDDNTIKIIDDADYNFWYDKDLFEPVIDSAENPLQDVELSQDFLALKPNNEQVWR